MAEQPITNENKENVAEQVLRIVEKKKPVLKLVGQDGNAFMILGLARRVAVKNKMDWEAIQKEAMSGDYDHLLQTMCKYFDVR